MKKRISILWFILIIFITVVSAASQINVGTNSTIQKNYSSQEILKGNLNISLQNVSSTSKVKFIFDSEEKSIKLFDFLESVDASYDCSSSNCETDYSSVGGSVTSKTIPFSVNQEKIIGMKIQTLDFSTITSFLMNFSSNSDVSCSFPLKIDLLNDGIIDWVPYTSLNETCSVLNNGYGCYEESRRENYAELTWNSVYCSKINVSAAAMVLVGANLLGTRANSPITIDVLDEDGNSFTCEFIANGNKEYSCPIKLNSWNKKTLDVCIRTDDEIGDYKLGVESNNPCGYSEESGEIEYDFAIFARPLKYAPLGKFSLTTSELDKIGTYTDIEGEIMDYIDDKYDNDCSSGCFIPINLSSGIAQTINVEKAEIKYSAAISSTVNEVWDLLMGASTIDMKYSFLNLAKAEILVPKETDDYTLKILIDNTVVLDNYKISVLETPMIDFVYPQKVPAGIKTLFRVFSTGKKPTKVTWNFGDNSTVEETKNNSIIHTYSKVGKFNLKIAIENNLGKSEETFDISSVSPKDYIESMLNLTKKRVAIVKAQIANLPAFDKSYLESKLELTATENKIKELENKYEDAKNSSSIYVSVVEGLNALKIPDYINYTSEGPMPFISNLDAMQLADFGIQDEDAYKTAVLQWSVQNIDAKISARKYFSITNRIKEILGVSIKIDASSKKEDMGIVSFAINKPSSEVDFGQTTGMKQGTGKTIIEYTEFTNEQINFVISDIANIAAIPAYFVPEADKIMVTDEESFSPCNNNWVCQAEDGETYKNCRKDCKPWRLILIWLLILLFIAFCIYIVLQEWYKRRYESHLFLNADELYNLINFIDNAEKQKISKEEIFKKLKEKNWNKEQLDYAWNKYKGLRTGMWEIPVFKFVEKITVKKKVEVLRQSGVSGKIAPIPGAIRPNMNNIAKKQNINKPLMFPKFGVKK